jgi:hypothetical protein
VRADIGYKFNTLSANCNGICDFLASFRVILSEIVTPSSPRKEAALLQLSKQVKTKRLQLVAKSPLKSIYMNKIEKNQEK